VRAPHTFSPWACRLNRTRSRCPSLVPPPYCTDCSSLTMGAAARRRSRSAGSSRRPLPRLPRTPITWSVQGSTCRHANRAAMRCDAVWAAGARDTHVTIAAAPMTSMFIGCSALVGSPESPLTAPPLPRRILGVLGTSCWAGPGSLNSGPSPHGGIVYMLGPRVPWGEGGAHTAVPHSSPPIATAAHLHANRQLGVRHLGPPGIFA
jgi:hypothetical protein